jgi:hypothetical protein
MTSITHDLTTSGQMSIVVTSCTVLALGLATCAMIGIALAASAALPLTWRERVSLASIAGLPALALGLATSPTMMGDAPWSASPLADGSVSPWWGALTAVVVLIVLPVLAWRALDRL